MLLSLEMWHWFCTVPFHRLHVCFYHKTYLCTTLVSDLSTYFIFVIYFMHAGFFNANIYTHKLQKTWEPRNILGFHCTLDMPTTLNGFKILYGDMWHWTYGSEETFKMCFESFFLFHMYRYLLSKYTNEPMNVQSSFHHSE